MEAGGRAVTSPCVILSESHLDKTVRYFLQQEAFVFDVESSGANRGIPHENTLTWLSMATNESAVVIPFGHPLGSRVIGSHKVPDTYKTGRSYMRTVLDYDDPPEQLSPAVVFDHLRPLFFSESIVKVAHNATFDLASVKKYFGAVPSPPFDDTIVLAWLLNENRHRLGLKYLVQDIFGFAYDDAETGRCVEKHPFDTVALYSYLDARYDWLLYRHLIPQIAEANLAGVHAIEADLIRVLVDMRLTGARVDVPRLRQLEGELTDRLEEIKGRVWLAAGRPFNINSVVEKRRLLFGRKRAGGQGLRAWKTTKGGAESTDDEVLASYPGNPLASALREYQDTAKVLSTYVVGYLGDESDPAGKPCRIFRERIHADFVQYGTVSGRMSCRQPNLQNIPRPDTALGKKIRGIWVAAAGHKLVVADFGQIELVVLAHYTGEGRLFDGFHQGIDPHRLTAATVLGIPPGEVTKDQRQYLGKAINFAVVYGAGVRKVATMAGVPIDEARAILAKHQRMFPEIYLYRDDLIKRCRKASPPHIRTLSGRMRRLPAINAGDEGLRMYSERQAFNSLIQGGAADIQKVAMIIAYDDQRRGSDITMILTVHDEIVLSAPEAKAELAAGILRDAMTGPATQSMISVPLSADVAIVDRWSDAK